MKITKEIIDHVMSMYNSSPKFTQQDIADLVGVSRTMVNRILHGYYYIDQRGKVRFDKNAKKAVPNDTDAALKPKDVSFDLDENGEVKDDIFYHTKLKYLAAKDLDDKEDKFLNEHGMRGMLYEARLCKYAFYILRELQGIKESLDNKRDYMNAISFSCGEAKTE